MDNVHNLPTPCPMCGSARTDRSNPYCKPCRAAYGRARRRVLRQEPKEGDRPQGRPRKPIDPMTAKFIELLMAKRDSPRRRGRGWG